MTGGGVALVGGGLANSLIAYRLAAQRPEVPLTIVEADAVGGNHTWCFHAGDLTPGQRAWMSPFVVREWDGYQVRFPDFSRRLSLRYCCVTAERLRSVLAAMPGVSILHDRARAVHADRVELASGRTLAADLVLDGRGARDAPQWELAWQVFLGLQVRLARPHGLADPIIMDATVAQDGAYRFVYCLPFSDTEILIEDTRYQDSRGFDQERLRAEINGYAERMGWTIEAILREEQGALPIVLSGDAIPARSGPVPVGMRAGLFHPVTGYSLPDAVRLADTIAAQPELTTAALHPMMRSVVRTHWEGHGFSRLLNRLLFLSDAPENRWRIMSRFYKLSEPLIGRLYAGRSSLPDMARILVGRPPVSFMGALASLPPSSARGFAEQAELL